MFRLILLIVALAIGAGAAWLAVTMRGEPVAVSTSAEPVAPMPLQEVLVATADLARGQPLTTENMRWQSWPESALNASYIRRSARPDAIEVLSGSLVVSNVVSGEPLREEKLSRADAGFLAAMLPPGKRAMAVRVSAETSAGGLILPKDRVDVVHTAGSKGNGGETEQTSRTILRNIPVLAIDQTVDEKSTGKETKDGKEKPTAVGKTATLEVDSEQAEILASAEATGTLSLALRSVADRAEPATVDFKAEQRVSQKQNPSNWQPSEKQTGSSLPAQQLTESQANQKPMSEPVTILRGGQTAAASTP